MCRVLLFVFVAHAEHAVVEHYANLFTWTILGRRDPDQMRCNGMILKAAGDVG
jgi:hypothetical protein